MQHLQISGHLFWFELHHPIVETKKLLFQEAEKSMVQPCGPAILITVRNLQTIDTRLVKHLDVVIKKSIQNLNSDNRYFYKRVNIIKPISYHYILESRIRLLKHV